MKTLLLIAFVSVMLMSSCESKSARHIRTENSVQQTEKVVVLSVNPFNEVVDRYKVLRVKDRTVAFITISVNTQYSVSDTIRTMSRNFTN